MEFPFEMYVERKIVVLILRTRQADIVLAAREALDCAKESEVIRSYAWRHDFAVMIPAPDWEPIEVKVELEALLKKRLGFGA